MAIRTKGNVFLEMDTASSGGPAMPTTPPKPYPALLD